MVICVLLTASMVMLITTQGAFLQTSVLISPTGIILEGTYVTLTCINVCFYHTHYSWIKDGVEVQTSGQMYIIGNIRPKDSGEYQCRSESWNYHETSPVVSLQVYYPPKNTRIEVNPSGEITEGSRVTLTCSTDANPSAHTYTWYKRGRSNYLRKTQVLVFTNIDFQDSGKYFCEASNDHGHNTSPDVNLHVVYPPRNTRIEVSPSGEITEGNRVTLTCMSEAYPPVHTYTWIKKSGAVEQTSREKTLTFRKIRSADSGEYLCRAANRIGHQDSPPVSVQVFFPPRTPVVVIDPPGQIKEGSRVTLTCSADANPPAHTYRWYKRGRSNYLRKTQVLVFTNIDFRDRGKYFCEASNDHGHNTSPDVNLHVVYPPKNTVIEVSPSGEITEGNRVTLTCMSEADPPAHTYTWIKKSGGVEQTSGEKTLTFIKIRSADSGEYLCRAANRIGQQISSAVSVQVLFPPRTPVVVIDPPGQITEGSKVTLTCSADANPPAHTYTWYKRGRSNYLRKTQVLVFPNVDFRDRGKYFCEASNDHGHNTSPDVNLHVVYPPKNTVIEVSPSGEITEGSRVTLTCMSEADPPVHTYTWYKKSGGAKPTSGEKTLTFIKIRSADNGDYLCRAANRIGHQDSPPVSVQVFYPPKNTAVLVAPSGVLHIGSSVTLTCSSDANPIVKSHTWYKVNESIPVGSGQQYSITNISSEDGGHYYCEARNKYGAEKSSPVPITVKGDRNALPPLLIVPVLCGVLGLFFALTLSVLLSNKCKNDVVSEARDQQTGNIGDIPTSSSGYQSLNPNTMQPNRNYHTLNPSNVLQSFGYQNVNPNNVPQSFGYQNLNPRAMQLPAALHHTMNPNNIQTSAV